MRTGSYVNGTWYHPASTAVTRNINPADTADVIAEFPLATAADVRRAIDAAERRLALLEEDARPRARPGAVAGRRDRRQPRRRDRAGADPRRRQGAQGSQGRGDEGHLAARVLRRRGLPHARQDAAVRGARHLRLHAAPAARRRGADRPVELPVGDSGVEVGAGAGRRQLRGVQAVGAGAGHGDAARRDLRRGRAAAGRLQHGGRQGRRGRRGDGRRARAAGDLVHRLEPRRAASSTSRRPGAAPR